MIGVLQGRHVRGGVVGLAVLALSALLATAVWVTTATGEPSYTRTAPLPPYEAHGPEPIELDDGGAVSVTTDADDDFVVQWRDPAGTRWSEPQDVGLSQIGLEGRDATIAARGDTVALSLSWYADRDDARENSALDAAVLCRDRECDVVARDTWLAPYLTADGTRALVVRRVESYSVVPDGPTYALLSWRADDDEWEPLEVDSPRPDDQAPRPELVMLGDGTLATVRAVLDEAGEGCRYELWASEPPADSDADLDTDLEVRHVVEAPGDESCSAGSPTTGTPDDPADPTSLSFTASGLDQTVTVSRAPDGWSDTAPEEEDGLLPAGPEGFGMVEAEVGTATTAVGSDDGRRIVGQFREAGETTWTRPVVLARARPGERCRTLTPETSDRDVVVAVSCWPTASRWGSLYDQTPPPTSGFALGTADGRTWDVVDLERPAYEPAVLDTAGLLVRGGDKSALWRPGAASFTEIRLPLPTPTVDALEVAGDQAVRVTGNEDPDARCRPTWATAPIDATAWQQSGDVTPVPAYARDLRRCYGVVFDRAVVGYGGRPGRQLEVAANGVDDEIIRIEGRLSRVDDGWVFRRGG